MMIEGLFEILELPSSGMKSVWKRLNSEAIGHAIVNALLTNSLKGN